ncbi:hypothetical protein AVEN_141605-1 [Araneus ventricosus]|uniref:Uncharacterized protein n=1 Tax=Araneus ventricosus TaxID=182803 RepID=A0A4Y2IL58_ARAVE|nr:hypothetical protein AVEN_141605-1 [Araneus ventricosus]
MYRVCIDPKLSKLANSGNTITRLSLKSKLSHDLIHLLSLPASKLLRQPHQHTERTFPTHSLHFTRTSCPNNNQLLHPTPSRYSPGASVICCSLEGPGARPPPLDNSMERKYDLIWSRDAPGIGLGEGRGSVNWKFSSLNVGIVSRSLGSANGEPMERKG